MTLNELQTLCAERTDHALAHFVPPSTANATPLNDAMRYSVFNGGKRIRPLLVYLSAHALGHTIESLDKPCALDTPACAVELIHAYSLIHDDLPAMDNADLRRGKPSCHKQFDEATAILAGDALQTVALQVLAEGEMPLVDAQCRLDMMVALTTACGPLGMAGGQALDLHAEGRTLTLDELVELHQAKTGALIRASVRLGALACNVTDSKLLRSLDDFASSIGLAFQVHDDILDIEADTETLGKPQGLDQENNKATFPALLGMDESKKRLKELGDQAAQALIGFGDNADPLRELAQYIVSREH